MSFKKNKIKQAISKKAHREFHSGKKYFQPAKTIALLAIMMLFSLFAAKAGDIVFDNGKFNVSNNLYVDAAGNVGIGITSPSQKLDVIGNVKGTGICIGSDCRTIWPGSVSIANGTSGQTLRNNGSGWVNNSLLYNNGVNIGIGTSKPIEKLSLGSGNIILPNGSSNINGNLYFGGDPSKGQFGLRLFGGYVNNAISAGFIDVKTNDSNDGLRIRVDTSFAATERMRITAAGNVGIGTTMPLAKLHAGDTVTDYSALSFTNTGAVVSSVGADQNQARSNVLTLMRDGVSGVRYAGAARFDMSKWASDGVSARTQLDIRLANTDTNTLVDVLSLQSSGNVGIGNTAPILPLDVAGTATAGIRYVKSGSKDARIQVSDPGRGWSMAVGWATQGDFSIIEEGIAGDRLYIKQGGNVGIGTSNPAWKLEVNGNAAKPGGGSWSATSDIRLKKNVNEIPDALDRLTSLHGVTFEWKNPQEQGNLTGTQIGMIAQEVEKVFPQWVSTNGKGYKDLTFRGFEALTVEAIKELKAENDDLRKRVEALESTCVSNQT